MKPEEMDALYDRVMDLDSKRTPGSWNWCQDRTMLVAYVDGKNELILWPGNAILGVDNGHAVDGYTDDTGNTKWSARMGSCGVRAETDAEANAKFIEAGNDTVTLLRAQREQLQAMRADAENWRYLKKVAAHYGRTEMSDTFYSIIGREDAARKEGGNG